MRKISYFWVAFTVIFCSLFSSCEYDDTEIWERVDELLARVQKLETTCEQQNSNIAALQTMLNGMKDNVYITSIQELDNNKGYSLEFSNGEKVEIYHGEKGDNGSTPSISIVKEGDEYYWTVNGEILKDEEGNGILVGDNDDSFPVLKTGSQLEAEGVEGNWEKAAVYVSIDNLTWKKIQTDSSNLIFTSVEISEDNQTVIITLSDGSVITLPKLEKILAMLYGTWKKYDFSDGSNLGDYLIFSEDGTLKMSAGNGNDDYMVGTFRFIPDKYIHCILNYDDSVYDLVWDIVEITEESLILLGNDDDLCGSYTRVTEYDDENNDGDSSLDANAIMLGTWNCIVYDEDGNVEESYSMTFDENGELSIDYDKPIADVSWSYSKESGLNINVCHIAGSNMTGTAYSAKPDNFTNPIKFTGDSNIWNYTSNGLYTTNTYRKFTLTKVVK